MKITLFGLAGSGTSTVGKMLANKREYTFMSTGNIMRKWADDAGYSLYEFEDTIVKNDTSFDTKLDLKVEEFWKKNNDFIFESRLAWHFIPDSFKIYLHCDAWERYTRIQKREWDFLDSITKKTQKRETELVTRYNEIYPEIVFPPHKDNFDLYIDATNISPDEILKIIVQSIKKQ